MIFCRSMIILSIHDLPRRSTFFPEGVFRPPSFQFTTSRGGRLPSHQWLPNTLPFNSRPPEEVDADGEVIEESQIPFNSRPPEEVDLRMFQDGICQVTFQFTTSGGGRLQNSTVFISKTLNFFNTFTNFSYSFLL